MRIWSLWKSLTQQQGKKECGKGWVLRTLPLFFSFSLLVCYGDFIFLGFKITADGDFSHEIKRYLLLGRKAMTNLDNVIKSRDITFLTEGHTVNATVFPVVMYKCESWIIKKAEHQRIDAFELWSWRRILWIPLTARKLNQLIFKEINSECSLGGLMLKLKL